MKMINDEVIVSLVHPMKYGYDTPENTKYTETGVIEDIDLSGITLRIEKVTPIRHLFIPNTNIRGIEWTTDKLKKKKTISQIGERQI